MIDQTRLPAEGCILALSTVEELVEVVPSLMVGGSGARRALIELSRRNGQRRTARTCRGHLPGGV